MFSESRADVMGYPGKGIPNWSLGTSPHGLLSGVGPDLDQGLALCPNLSGWRVRARSLKWGRRSKFGRTGSWQNGEFAKRGVCRTGLRVVGSCGNMAGKVSGGAGRTGLKQGLASVCGAQFDSVWRVSARK